MCIEGVPLETQNSHNDTLHRQWSEQVERRNNVPRNYWEWQKFLRNIEPLFHWHFIQIVNKARRWRNKYNYFCNFYIFISGINYCCSSCISNQIRKNCTINSNSIIFAKTKSFLTSKAINACTFPVKAKIHVMLKVKINKIFLFCV